MIEFSLTLPRFHEPGERQPYRGTFEFCRTVDELGFAGGFIGYLARTDDISFANLKEAIIQGTLVASFCCEEFSLRRLERLSESEIHERRKAFGAYIA